MKIYKIGCDNPEFKNADITCLNNTDISAIDHQNRTITLSGGGTVTYDMLILDNTSPTKTAERTIPSAEDIGRVKGLGFLRDKTTEDCFNARVLTRNGGKCCNRGSGSTFRQRRDFHDHPSDH